MGAMYSSKFIESILSSLDESNTPWRTDFNARRAVLKTHTTAPMNTNSSSPCKPSPTKTNVARTSQTEAREPRLQQTRKQGMALA
eukprot:scaffold1883_cov396-Prasinococcus_capsulatus_cf.AAC.19